MPVVSLMPYRIAVLGRAGEFLFWADEERARDLLKTGEVTLIRSGGRVRVLHASSRLVHAVPDGRGTGLDNTRYSHNHETQQNPPRVWTLKPIRKRDRQAFTAVLGDITATAA